MGRVLPVPRVRRRRGRSLARRGRRAGDGGLARPGARLGTRERDRPGRRPRAGARRRRPVGLPHGQGQGRRPRRVRSPTTSRGSRRSATRWAPAGAVRVDANGAWDVDTAVDGRPRARPRRRRAGVRRAALRHDRRARGGPPAGGRADRRRRVDPPGRRPAAGRRRRRRGRRGAQVHAAGRGRAGAAGGRGGRAAVRRVVRAGDERRAGGRARAGRGAAGAGVRLRAGHAGAARRRPRARTPSACARSTAGCPSPALPRRPDPALLDAHRLRDPERARWWHDRLARTARILGVPNL